MKNKKLIIIIAAVLSLVLAVAAIVILAANSKKDNSVPGGDVPVNSQIEEEKAPQEETKKEDPKKQEDTQKPQNEEKPKQDEKEQENNASKDNGEKKKEEKTYTPTFMYFISSSDEGFEDTNKTINRLKKEYEGRVVFDIRNIDKTPEDKENFPIVLDNTPTLIMLNTKNEIDNILFKTKDEQTLKNAIDKALGN